jgi:kynurenine formamidase
MAAAAAQGIVTRAAYVDVPRHLGVEWLEPGFLVTPALLEDCLARDGVNVEPGDALIIATGRDRRDIPAGPAIDFITEGAPGLTIDCVAWLQALDVSLLVSDAAHDVMLPGGKPHPMPIHVGALVGLGLWLADNAHLEQLAKHLRQAPQSHVLLVLAPLSFSSATGSPVNPIAIL